MEKFSLLIFLLASFAVDKSRGYGGIIECGGIADDAIHHMESGATIVIKGQDYKCFMSDERRMPDLVEHCEIFKFSNMYRTECSQLISFRMVNSSLPTFLTDLFLEMPRVQQLIVAEGKLMHIYRKDFERATNLLMLDLNTNYIATLEKRIFSRLKKLNYLDLSYNKLTSLEKETFFGASEHLYEVNLAGNLITVLDYAVFMPIAGRTKFPLVLNLNLNDIEEVKEIDEVMESYRENLLIFHKLSLNDNKISAFSCSYVKATEALIERNHLQTLSFDNCNIENLSVDSNNLEFLNIHSNMRALIANRNKIESLLIGENSKMHRMEIADNGNIKATIPSLKTLASIKFLNVSHSQVGSELDDDTFAQMRNLRYLHMSACGVTFVPFEIFVNNNQLLIIDISHNNIEVLDLYTFSGLTELIQLNLAGNKLSRIAYVEHLRRVVPSLREITLVGNPWKCTELSTIVRTMHIFNVRISDVAEKAINVRNIFGVPCAY